MAYWNGSQERQTAYAVRRILSLNLPARMRRLNRNYTTSVGMP